MYPGYTVNAAGFLVKNSDGSLWFLDVDSDGAYALAPDGSQLIESATSPAFALRSILVNDGDSLYQFTGSTFPTTSLTPFCTDDLPKSFIVAQNVSIGGATCDSLLSTFFSRVTPLYQSGVPFVVSLLVGGNDVRAGDSAATIITNLKAYVSAVKALGSNALCALSTYPVQCDVSQSPTWTAVLQTVNNDLIANWNVSQGSGGYGADALVNYWADPTIGPGNYTSSLFCNTNYSADGHHGNDAVKQIMGQIEASALAPLL